jgi:diguanylate cyclase (GGDEF)-like protein
LLLPDHLARDHDGWIESYCRGNGESSVLGRVREMLLHCRNGDEIPVELKAVDLGQSGGHHYLGAFLQSILERKSLEAERQKLVDQFQRLAMTDPLTDLPNRRAFDIEVARLVAQMRRTGQPAAVAILDIDRFKRVNDTYGHAVGDDVLRKIGKIVPLQLRAGDFVARVGGEEFGLLMPNTNRDQAIGISERLRQTIAATQIENDGHAPLAVTVSIGITAIDVQEPFESSWKRADQSLYDAKESGRNCTIFK